MTETTIPEHLTDEALTAKLQSGLPGQQRRAAMLLEVPADYRLAVSQEHTYRMNTVGAGWRPSDLLWQVIKDFRAGEVFTSPCAREIASRTDAELVDYLAAERPGLAATLLLEGLGR